MKNIGKPFALWWLLSAALSVSVGAAQEQYATVKGRITWHAAIGTPSVANPRVQIMDPKSGKAKMVLEGTEGDRAGGYKIENLAEGSYDIVACTDHLLDYEPKRQTVKVQRDKPDIDLSLELVQPLAGFIFPAGNWKVMYFKHIDTGCESGPIQADHGVFTIKNVAEQAFYLDYVFCVDTAKEADDAKAPFESCLRKQIAVGLTTDQLAARLTVQPQKIIKHRDSGQMYVYKYARVTIVGGKVSDVKIGLEPAP